MPMYMDAFAVKGKHVKELQNSESFKQANEDGLVYKEFKSSNGDLLILLSPNRGGMGARDLLQFGLEDFIYVCIDDEGELNIYGSWLDYPFEFEVHGVIGFVVDSTDKETILHCNNELFFCGEQKPFCDEVGLDTSLSTDSTLIAYADCDNLISVMIRWNEIIEYIECELKDINHPDENNYASKLNSITNTDLLDRVDHHLNKWCNSFDTGPSIEITYDGVRYGSTVGILGDPGEWEED